MIDAIEKLPRVGLGFYPTPLTDAQHLSQVLGGPRILIKREDLSGLALGGNKCRKFEFILAEAKRQGANAVISTASSQSNFCLQLAAAGRRLGMKPSFVLIRGVHVETQGNLLLHNILDSDVEILKIGDMSQISGSAVYEAQDRLADDLRSKGYKPFVMRHAIPDISALLGPVGWVNAADELITQLKAQNMEAQYIMLANGGGGTQGGLVLGAKYLRAGLKVMGITVLNRKDTAVAATRENIEAVSEFLGLGVKVSPDELEIDDSYLGQGYGIPTTECIDAIRLVAQTEGIFLDPVYTGKAMAGLIDMIKKGRFKATDTIVFIHTGGIPALFAYDKEVAR
ncbi:MAG: pyridoxal-phosphate dependent enzyme [Chloroflexi bacterium]|nr:pyridoxal-phosphate dependent enzyme [Chloroflexota bacterium]